MKQERKNDYTKTSTVMHRKHAVTVTGTLATVFAVLHQCIRGAVTGRKRMATTGKKEETVNDKMVLPTLGKRRKPVERCVAADRFFRKWYPKFYRKIQGYFNLGFISKDEFYYRVMTWVEYCGIDYYQIRSYLLDFIGIPREPVEYVEKRLLRDRRPKRNGPACRILNKNHKYTR